jgi:hypothetical protein
LERRRLPDASLLQLLLQKLAPLHELGALLGVAGRDGVDAVAQTDLSVGESVA